MVLLTLHQHHLFAKRSKCSSGETTVTYLGHVISSKGVAIEQKVQAVADWPAPKTVRAVCGFLGLAGYCRKFNHDFGTIAARLTKLLRKEAFAWTIEATTAFTSLKTALTTAPVLHLPDFALDFVVECDASGSGFRAILHQGAGPLAKCQTSSL